MLSPPAAWPSDLPQVPSVALPESGLHLSTLSQVTESDVEQATERAIGAGYRHIDTAYVYQNEEAIGRALQRKMADGTVTRDDLFCTTKVLRVRPRPPSLPAQARRLSDREPGAGRSLPAGT